MKHTLEKQHRGGIPVVLVRMEEEDPETVWKEIKAESMFCLPRDVKEAPEGLLIGTKTIRRRRLLND